jgi:hypothetical protein
LDVGNIVEVVPKVVIDFDVSFESSKLFIKLECCLSADKAPLCPILCFFFFFFSKVFKSVDNDSGVDFLKYDDDNKNVEKVNKHFDGVIPLIKVGKTLGGVGNKTCSRFVG